ncbi:MAG: EamA/RhaT family transporter, partial [Proteobacteria bacterium]|nr:EamA/RhaT family transporter [Pseudomonadota bacterium]
YLAFTPAFLAFTGRWILGEAPNPLAYLGIALVTAGGYGIQLAPGMGPLGPLRALLRERGSLLMLVVALLYSVTSALGKVAVLASAPPTFALTYYAALTLALAPWAVPALRGCGGQWMKPALPVGLSGAAMVLFHFSAIRLAPASYMIAVKRSSLLWSILLGRFVLGEANLARRLAGGAVLLAGVAVLAASS